MTHMDDDAVERLERAAHLDEAKAITVRAADLRALLASYKAMREALGKELADLEADILWSETGELERLLVRRKRIEAALSTNSGESVG